MSYVNRLGATAPASDALTSNGKSVATIVAYLRGLPDASLERACKGEDPEDPPGRVGRGIPADIQALALAEKKRRLQASGTVLPPPVTVDMSRPLSRAEQNRIFSIWGVCGVTGALALWAIFKKK